MTSSAAAIQCPPLAIGAEAALPERKARRSSAGTPSSLPGMLWCAGWLFTIGFAKLVWWKAILGLIVWPYFLGTSIR